MNFLYHAILLASLLLLSPMDVFSETPLCYKNIEANFFKPEFVDEALSLHSVPQSNWTLINNELREKMVRVPELVREKAKKMNPNPFGMPFQPQEASEVLRQALFAVFAETLADFHITNRGKAEEMFQYIRQRQGLRLLACFGEETELEHK